MNQVIRRFLLANGFTIDPANTYRYVKMLRDRWVFVDVFPAGGAVFILQLPVAWYSTLEELELAIIYQSLRPLEGPDP